MAKVSFTTNSYGKTYTTLPKGSIIIDHPHSDLIATELLERFGFLKDITPGPIIHVDTKQVVERNQKGKRYMKTKKVVSKAEGVKRS